MSYKRIEELGVFNEELIGFNELWIDPDFNPNGTRLAFQTDGGDLGWCSLRWNNSQESWCEDYLSAPTHYILIPKTTLIMP